MIIKKIKYVDYKGVAREDELFFNLTKAEVAEMELSYAGGLSAKVDRITKTKDSSEIIAVFKELILSSYGIISDDGKRFIKSDKLREEFSQTEAYSELFMELAGDADAASAFINGIIPVLDTKNNVVKTEVKTEVKKEVKKEVK